MTISESSRTPRRASARIALHTSPVAHQRKIPAFAAHLAFVALGLRLGAAIGLGGGGLLARRSRLAPLQGFQLLGRRQIVLGFLL